MGEHYMNIPDVVRRVLEQIMNKEEEEEEEEA